MGIVKRVFKLVRNLTLAVLMAAVLLPWWVVVSERLSSGPFRAYLPEHVQVMELDETGGGLRFDDDFYDGELFIAGEIHGTQTAQLVDLRLMQHLNQRVGLRHVMAELDPTQADRINAYLASGDESHIRPIFEAWLDAATQWGNQQHLEKLRAIYDYNMDLPAERRLTWFGVDRIQDRENALAWLAQRLSDEDTASPARELRQRLVDGERGEEVLVPLLGAAAAQLNEEGHLMLAYMAESILADFDAPDRYERVEANIRTMVDRFGIGDDEPVYGFWGLFHSLGVTVNEGARPLVLRLRDSDLPFADGVVNLSMSYANSSQNMPSRMLPDFLQPDSPFFEATASQDNPYLAYLQGIGDMKAVAGDAEAAVFRINAPDSPYANGARMVRQTGLLTFVFPFRIDESEGFPTDYAILIQDAPALTPFEG